MKEPLVQPSSSMYRINVTPIIDVALVLVIILLVTAPLMTVADMDVELPGARTRPRPGRSVCPAVRCSRGSRGAVF